MKLYNNSEEDETPWISWSYEEQGRFLDLWCQFFSAVIAIVLFFIGVMWFMKTFAYEYRFQVIATMFLGYVALEVYWRLKK